MTNTLNRIIIFFLHQNQNIFFSNIGNQNIFLEKKPYPLPFKVNGHSLRPKKKQVCFRLHSLQHQGRQVQIFLFLTCKYTPSSKITQTCFFLSFLLQLINYLTCSTTFLIPNIDQMYKEMKKIVEVGNKHVNEDEFPDFVDLFIFFWHKKMLGSVVRKRTYIFFCLITYRPIGLVTSNNVRLGLTNCCFFYIYM